MSTQHLSDEAVAAFADGVLTGLARERATRHTGRCPECAHAVAVQREAVWALRAAPAPRLPSHLIDRLKSVPQTTPIEVAPPSALGPDGSAMFAAFGTRLAPMTSAAFVPPEPHQHSKIRPLVLTAAAVAVAGALAVGSSARVNSNRLSPAPAGPAQVNTVSFNHLPVHDLDITSVHLPAH